MPERSEERAREMEGESERDREPGGTGEARRDGVSMNVQCYRGPPTKAAFNHPGSRHVPNGAVRSPQNRQQGGQKSMEALL